MEAQTMSVLKQASIETLKRLPDECTVDDIMYEINFVAQVYEGLKDADEGKLITTEELLKRVDRWAK
jgi:predicted transcriptional regulator